MSCGFLVAFFGCQHGPPWVAINMTPLLCVCVCVCVHSLRSAAACLGGSCLAHLPTLLPAHTHPFQPQPQCRRTLLQRLSRLSKPSVGFHERAPDGLADEDMQASPGAAAGGLVERQDAQKEQPGASDMPRHTPGWHMHSACTVADGPASVCVPAAPLFPCRTST